jgi:glycosyltransferase involved in cell wall biosynthesis
MSPRSTGSGAAPTGPLVSVIVPTFNRTRYLKTALDSALAQSYGNIEVLVTDDASTADVYGEVIATYADPRIKYRRNPTNLGMGLNTWTALSAASGKYVATLHDDDIWEPGFLATLVPPLEADVTLSVAFCDHHIIDENGVLDVAAADANARKWNRAELTRGRIHPLLEGAVVSPIIPSAMAALFRKSAIDWNDFPPEIGTYYDQWLSYLSARTGAAGYYEPTRLTRYRVHAASETLAWGTPRGRLRALRQSEFIFRRYLEDSALAGLRAVLEPRYIKVVASFTLALLDSGLGDEARAMLGRVHAQFPRLAFRIMMLPTFLPKSLQGPFSRSIRRARARLGGGGDVPVG